MKGFGLKLWLEGARAHTLLILEPRRCKKCGRFKLPCRMYVGIGMFLAGTSIGTVFRCTYHENEDQLHSIACLDHDHGSLRNGSPVRTNNK